MKENVSVNRAKILEKLKEKKSEKRNITFRVEAHVLDKFQRDCEKNRVSMNEVVSLLIENYINEK